MLMKNNRVLRARLDCVSAFSAKRVVCCLLLVLISSCSYLKHASIQAKYNRIQHVQPGQINLKHMIDRDTYFVFGRTVDSGRQYADLSIAIAAYSDKFRSNERVDTMYFAGAGTHFGLNLPAGEYRLVVFADKDDNNVFDHSEVVGRKTILLNKSTAPEKVLGHSDIQLEQSLQISWAESIPLPAIPEPKTSLFFPKGSIRSLDEAIFDKGLATLGMYEPASFLERAPNMFYALEEDLGYKIPVVFVHGMDGTPRSFKPIIDRLDRERYKPWIFYYPSGADLNQLAEFFYRIFLSGDAIPLGDMPMIVVAHSVGGVVVREALNKYENNRDENKIELLVTIASPLGGSDAAASGEKHGLIVLPAWRDLNPDNDFIKQLYRKPLPEFVHHQLLYAYRNDKAVKLGENSDGSVALSSQLHPPAQQQSDDQFGYNSTHSGILKNQRMIDHLLKRMASINGTYPDSHLAILKRGGFNVNFGREYDPKSKYIIRTVGHYLAALSRNEITPLHPDLVRFVQVINGEITASSDLEKAWLRFQQEYPDMIGKN
jgi:triacylglycerol esterase/lipase EstA (alpha/beta hydrolase family)